jgi:hypothetical protein
MPPLTAQSHTAVSWKNTSVAGFFPSWVTELSRCIPVQVLKSSRNVSLRSLPVNFSLNGISGKDRSELALTGEISLNFPRSLRGVQPFDFGLKPRSPVSCSRKLTTTTRSQSTSKSRLVMSCVSASVPFRNRRA